MGKKNGEKQGSGLMFIIISCLILMVVFSSAGKEDETQINSSGNNEVSEESRDKENSNNDALSNWDEGYNLIESPDMFKEGETIYWQEGEGYEPTFVVLEVASDVTLDNGYVSKKAMKVQSCSDENDVFWKDIEATLNMSAQDYGVKYYTKGWKFNP